MKNIKIIRVNGNKDGAKEIADYLNRQGRIGNTAHAEFVASGDDLLCTIFADGKKDDGRNIPDIEDRKRVLIIRLGKNSDANTDAATSALLEKFYEEQEADGAVVSKVRIIPAEESVYFVVIAGIPNRSDDWDDEEDLDDEDDSDKEDDEDSDDSDEDEDDFLGFTEE